VDYSNYPDLLTDKRGPVSGLKFFSKSPFHSIRVLVVTATDAVCILLDLFLLFRYWSSMHSHVKYVLIVIGFVLLSSWWGSIRNLRRLRALYLEFDEETKHSSAGSSMDIALGVAAGGITNCLLCISGITFLVVMYFAYFYYHA